MKPKVLVTGADGMLGSVVVRELLQQHYEVQAMIQPGRKSKTLEGLPITRMEADICNVHDVKRTMQGCDYVIHAAASTAIHPARSMQVFEINLQGSVNVMNCAMKLGIKRLIHVSSANVFAAGTKENPGDENGRFNGYKYGLDYINSKYFAHKAVLSAVEAGLDAVIANPTFMFGPYDSLPGSGRIILALKAGEIKAIPPGGKNFICSQDVAVALVNALRWGRKGESYVLGHENLSYAEIFNCIAKEVKSEIPKLRLPAPIIRATACVAEFISSIFGTQTTFTTPVAAMACDTHYFKSDKAIRELKLPQTPIAVGVANAFAWFKQNGYTR